MAAEDVEVAESLILRPEMEGAINRSKPEFKMLSLLGNAGVLHCREELGLGNGCKDSRGWRQACDAESIVRILIDLLLPTLPLREDPLLL